MATANHRSIIQRSRSHSDIEGKERAAAGSEEKGRREAHQERIDRIREERKKREFLLSGRLNVQIAVYPRFSYRKWGSLIPGAPLVR